MPTIRIGKFALRQIGRAIERYAQCLQAVVNRRNLRRDAGRQPLDDNDHRIFECFVRPTDVDVEARRADKLREIEFASWPTIRSKNGGNGGPTPTAIVFSNCVGSDNALGNIARSGSRWLAGTVTVCSPTLALPTIVAWRISPAGMLAGNVILSNVSAPSNRIAFQLNAFAQTFDSQLDGAVVCRSLGEHFHDECSALRRRILKVLRVQARSLNTHR